MALEDTAGAIVSIGSGEGETTEVDAIANDSLVLEIVEKAAIDASAGGLERAVSHHPATMTNITTGPTMAAAVRIEC